MTVPKSRDNLWNHGTTAEQWRRRRRREQCRQGAGGLSSRETNLSNQTLQCLPHSSLSQSGWWTSETRQHEGDEGLKQGSVKVVNIWNKATREWWTYETRQCEAGEYLKRGNMRVVNVWNKATRGWCTYETRQREGDEHMKQGNVRVMNI